MAFESATLKKIGDNRRAPLMRMTHVDGNFICLTQCAETHQFSTEVNPDELESLDDQEARDGYMRKRLDHRRSIMKPKLDAVKKSGGGSLVLRYPELPMVASDLVRSEDHDFDTLEKVLADPGQAVISAFGTEEKPWFSLMTKCCGWTVEVDAKGNPVNFALQWAFFKNHASVKTFLPATVPKFAQYMRDKRAEVEKRLVEESILVSVPKSICMKFAEMHHPQRMVIFISEKLYTVDDLLEIRSPEFDSRVVAAVDDDEEEAKITSKKLPAAVSTGLSKLEEQAAVEMSSTMDLIEKELLPVPSELPEEVTKSKGQCAAAATEEEEEEDDEEKAAAEEEEEEDDDDDEAIDKAIETLFEKVQSKIVAFVGDRKRYNAAHARSDNKSSGPRPSDFDISPFVKMREDGTFRLKESLSKVKISDVTKCHRDEKIGLNCFVVKFQVSLSETGQEAVLRRLRKRLPRHSGDERICNGLEKMNKLGYCVVVDVRAIETSSQTHVDESAFNTNVSVAFVHSLVQQPLKKAPAAAVKKTTNDEKRAAPQKKCPEETASPPPAKKSKNTDQQLSDLRTDLGEMMKLLRDVLVAQSDKKHKKKSKKRSRHYSSSSASSSSLSEESSSAEEEEKRKKKKHKHAHSNKKSEDRPESNGKKTGASPPGLKKKHQLVMEAAADSSDEEFADMD